MNKNSLLITSLSTVIASSILINPAFALDLYVDIDTQQIYASPGNNRVKLGSFEKKEDMDQLKATLKAEIEAELKSKQNANTKKSVTTKAASTYLDIDQADASSVAQAPEPVKKGNISANVSYGKNSFEFRTDNDKFSLAIHMERVLLPA